MAWADYETPTDVLSRVETEAPMLGGTYTTEQSAELLAAILVQMTEMNNNLQSVIALGNLNVSIENVANDTGNGLDVVILP